MTASSFSCFPFSFSYWQLRSPSAVSRRGWGWGLGWGAEEEIKEVKDKVLMSGVAAV